MTTAQVSIRLTSILDLVIDALDLPESDYKRAVSRYEDLGEFLNRSESKLVSYQPHVFAQGSFGLGLVTRPLNPDEEYDLDLGCELSAGLSRGNITQKKLKEMIGGELENYRSARNIQARLEAKHRCWRLKYQDNLSFHMDAVPCIPTDSDTSVHIAKAMTLKAITEDVADRLSRSAVFITDDRLLSYPQVSNDWRISNPLGYADWFRSRMASSPAVILKAEKVDDVPLYARKTPLQRAIVVLKRHRDVMFKDDADLRPISIIITTLAARAYNGQSDLPSALHDILKEMENHISDYKPRVPNPVLPNEDFADRWYTPEGKQLQLEQSFRDWIAQAKRDLLQLELAEGAEKLSKRLAAAFNLTFNSQALSDRLGIPISVAQPQTVQTIVSPPKPWYR